MYRYDPNEFHGPTLYYAALPSVWLHGLRNFAQTQEADYRLPIVVVRRADGAAPAPLADGLGRGATLWAGLLLRRSRRRLRILQPLLYSGDAARLLHAGDDRVRLAICAQPPSRMAVAASLCAGLMIATKETAVLAFAAMGAHCGSFLVDTARGWRKRAVNNADVPPPGSRTLTWKAAALGAVIALAVACLFVSGFLRNPAGPIDYLRSYTPWLQRAHTGSLHRYPWYYYLSLLLWTHHGKGPVWSEALIVGLALIGFITALLPRSRNLFQGDLSLARFLAFYTLILTALYSAIPYKTPWCLISFLNGMILLAGIGLAAIIDLVRNRPAKALLGIAFLAGCVQLGIQSYRTSYQAFTDPDNPYVYAQPVPDVENLGRWAWDVAHYSGRGPGMLVKVIWIDDYHWPIAWYLREFNNIQKLEGFYHDTSDPNAPLVLASPEFEDELTKKLDKTHVMTKFFGIRPGVFAQAWVRMDCWERYLKMRPKPKDDE